MGKADTRKSITFCDGSWHDSDPKILAAGSHAVWLASVVFDGARALAGAAPDLDRHCARAIISAQRLGLAPTVDAETLEALAWDGIARFEASAELYICPMFYAESGFVIPDPASTRFVLSIHESPLPAANGFSACRSSFRRPARDMAPTDAKASCLYPNIARAVQEAQQRGFDTAVVLDPSGNVAEFAYKNLFLVVDGEVHTPAPNGTYLNGITRQRVIALLRDAGVRVVERAVEFSELAHADELFATGNYAKVEPCTRIEEQQLGTGPLYRQARDLYFEYARSCTRPGDFGGVAVANTSETPKA